MKKLIFVIYTAFWSLNIIAQCPTPITFSINPTPATCSTCCDGGLTVTNIQNGCPAYNVQINPFVTPSSFGAFSNLCAGTNYTVTVYDNGCCGSTPLICSINYSTATTCSTPITYTSNVTNATCNSCCNGSATITNISGGCSPFNINWSSTPVQTGTTATGLCAGSYTATISDAGCCPVVTFTTNITQPPPCTNAISYSIITTPETCPGCCDGTASITNLTGGCGTPYSFTWMPGSMSSQTVTGLCSGNYSVSVSDFMGGNCCPNVTQGCFVPPSTTTGLAKTSSESDIVVVIQNQNGNFKLLLPKNLPYPNSISVRNISGKELVIVYPARSYEIDFDLFEKEPAGVYVISIIYSDKVLTKKIVKN